MASATETVTISGTEQTQRSSIKRSDVIAFIALAVISSLMFLPFLGAAGLFDPTDSFFVEAPREMLQTAQFTVPMYNYEPWLDKPAFAFWLIIGCYKLLGVNEFAARLPSALSGILLTLTTFGLSRQLLTRRQAFLSALVLACSPLFLLVGRVALTDEPLALFLTTALLSLAVALYRPHPVGTVALRADDVSTGVTPTSSGQNTALQSFLPLLIAYPALGLAALCKGPPLTLGLVGVITLIYLLLTKSTKKLLPSIYRLHPIMGILIVLAVASPYYIWAHQATHGAFTETFFVKQNLGRAVGAVNHVNPWWWYAPVVVAGFLPWSVVAAFARKFLVRLIRCRSRLNTARSQLLFFALCWAAVGFVAFSAVPTKLQTYIVPIFPALAILMGNYIDLLVRKNRPTPLVVATCVMLVIAIGAPVLVHALAFGRETPAMVAYLSAISLGVGTAISIWLNRKDAFRVAITVFTAVVFAFATLVPTLSILYHDRYQINIDKVVEYSLAQGANLGIVQYKFNFPSAIYRYQKQIPVFENAKDLQSFANEPGKRWLLVDQEVLSLLCWTERSPRVIAHSGKYWLFTVGRNAMQEPSVEWHGLLPQYKYPKVDELLLNKETESE
jgi:4-amino-4-deoxy-L-arabinose transferase-like glycosyltransferase